MSMYLTFTIGKDKRNLVDDITDFHIDNSTSTNPQWLQARQNEDGMRQVFVTVKNEDGSPFNLTDCNYWFQGKLPDGIHKIIDARHGVTLDAQNGKFRFDMPKHAFTVAGSYVQAFFRIVRNGESITTLEFDLTVLSDLVYNDLVPSDYITPFEDLYGKLKDYITKANGDFDAAMAKWKKDVADLITELNADIGGINLTITEIKTQLASLEGKIKADGLLTQADLNVALAGVLKSVNEAVETVTGGLTYLSDDMMTDVNGGYTDLQKLKEFKNGIDTDAGLTRIAFATDTHHEAESNWRPHMTSGLRHALNPMYVQGVVNAVIFNGDNINNGGGGDKATANYLVQDFSTTVRSLVDSDTPVLINKGNHDNNYKDATVFDDARSLPSQVLTNAELAHYYGYDVKDDRIIRDGSSAYCYIDLPNNVRMYMLDSYDTPETLDKDGYLDFNARQNSIYSQKQLQWLANTLDASKTTVLFAHNPVEQVFGTGNASNEINHDVLHKLLNAFISGGSGTINGITGITVRYTFEKAGTIAGVFTGHLHKSSIVVDGTINYVQTTCQAVYADGDHREERANKFGTYQEDAFDVIEIDPVKKHVKLKRYGYGEDREYDY
ncbi:phage baseplate upper protein [Pediococcus pentosaceus]|uniref:phage baseplate upper protein n=1 Tax=Pediococcus pentosaceus TaxID=1255 RepID=UPI0018A16592|nr:phage baseplate upper protein [Pediococcus pentosaceus]MBF7109883.1 phage baseplate upper protein [Pediococcus pentosaceus]QQA93173.1 phage baseplate upper protein [Pediococcus pentosaceus]